jgi:hypothetical protein
VSASTPVHPPAADLEHAGSRDPVKVVYVMGAAHSGSTILGVALGNCAEFFYAGEVEEWLVNGGEPDYGGTERTRFWRAVREQVSGAEDLFGTQVNRCLERSSALFRVGRWRQRRRLRGRFRRVTGQLYEVIARTSGARHIVDTSVFPLRARELKALTEIELYLVFLVRDPQGVVASELRGIHRQDRAERHLRTLTTNLNLWLTNLVSLLVFQGHPRERRLFVRHEDFLAEPAGVLRAILELVGSHADIPDLASLRTGIPLVGNKLIRSEVVAVRPAQSRAPRSSRLTALVQLPWRALLARIGPNAGAAGSRSDSPETAE